MLVSEYNELSFLTFLDHGEWVQGEISIEKMITKVEL
jgi:hypothetical protein